MFKTLLLFSIFAFMTASVKSESLSLSHGPEYGKPIPYSKVEASSGTIAAEISDGKLYSVGSGVLSIYDISNPKSPRLLGRSARYGDFRQMAVRGNLVFIAARASGFYVFDVSRPENPKMLSHFDPVENGYRFGCSGKHCLSGTPRLWSASS